MEKYKNFLAVDTSGNHLAVVAVKDGKTAYGKIENCAMRQSASVMAVIDETLKKADLRVEECDFFAAAVGAGSFTGIRIGISIAKGFALACGKPTLPVTSFDVAAYNAIDDGGKLLAVVDALHDCYYVCGYEKGEVVYPPAYLTETEVLALIDEGYALCGCATAPIAKKTAMQIVDPAVGLEKATLARANAGAFGELTAVYVRKSSAEINTGK